MIYRILIVENLNCLAFISKFNFNMKPSQSVHDFGNFQVWSKALHFLEFASENLHRRPLSSFDGVSPGNNEPLL